MHFMAEDLEQVIEDAAAKPESLSVDGTAIKRPSLSELIKADKHLAARKATRDFSKSFCRMKVVPPGTI